MAVIIRLSSRTAILREPARRTLRTFKDLGGQTPPDHPVAGRNDLGLVHLVVGQVWVAKKGGRLWRIHQVQDTGINSTFPLAVLLMPLAGRKSTRTLSEQELRKTMLVYEDAVRSFQSEIRRRAQSPLLRGNALPVILGGKRPP